MDVPKINLLQSAERLLQEKRNTAQDVSGKQAVGTSADQVQFSSVLSSKYFNIQNRLKDEQNELTKTQTKLGILNEPGTEKEGLINILFGKTPLFEELREMAQFDKDAYIKDLTQTKEKQLDSIKKLEVEFENILSAGMVADPSKFAGNLDKLHENMIKPIPEKVVERLIKD